MNKDAEESILSIQVDATLSGHDLGPFEPVEVLTGGYEARCRKCKQPPKIEPPPMLLAGVSLCMTNERASC